MIIAGVQYTDCEVCNEKPRETSLYFPHDYDYDGVGKTPNTTGSYHVLRWLDLEPLNPVACTTCQIGTTTAIRVVGLWLDDLSLRRYPSLDKDGRRNVCDLDNFQLRSCFRDQSRRVLFVWLQIQSTPNCMCTGRPVLIVQYARWSSEPSKCQLPMQDMSFVTCSRMADTVPKEKQRLRRRPLLMPAQIHI